MARVGMQLTGDWERAARTIPGLGARVGTAIQKAVLQEAHFVRKKLIEAIQQGGPEGVPWRPHSPMTLAIRQLLGNAKTKLLIQSGDLRNSIAVVPFEGGVFVGINRTAIHKGSKIGLVNLAQIHEEGREYQLTLTDKQRRLIFAAMRIAGIERRPTAGPRPPGQGVRVTIRIPARPLFGPVFARYGRPADLEASILARVAKLLGGDVGTASGAPRE